MDTLLRNSLRRAIKNKNAILVIFLSFCFVDYAFAFVRDRSQSQNLRVLTPTLNTPTKFGSSVSLDFTGGFAIVGAEGSNEAYIFEQNFNTAATTDTTLAFWGQRTTLSGAANSRFGAAVAIKGQYALVGAPLENTGMSNSGSAYFYGKDQGSANSWGAIGAARSADAGRKAVNGMFGASVDMSSDYAAVGCPRCLIADKEATGAVFVYARSSTWGLMVVLSATDYRAGMGFGGSVSLSDDYLAVGASTDRTWVTPHTNYLSPGSVYVFSRATLFTEYKKLIAPTADLADGLMFGWFVSVRESNLLISAFGQRYYYHFLLTGENDWTQYQLYSSSSVDYPPDKLAFADCPMQSDGEHAIVGDPYYGTNGGAFLVPHKLIGISTFAQRRTPSAKFTWVYS